MSDSLSTSTEGSVDGEESADSSSCMGDMSSSSSESSSRGSSPFLVEAAVSLRRTVEAVVKAARRVAVQKSLALRLLPLKTSVLTLPDQRVQRAVCHENFGNVAVLQTVV